jgi:nicotinate-nucleotide pyrophosphorylase (carboxylating)
MRLPPATTLLHHVRSALAEDGADHDLTAAIIAADRHATAQIISREAAIFCGQAWADLTFRELDPAIAIEWQVEDGAAISANQPLCTLRGPARPLLTGERTALNFLQTLSATATTTHEWVAILRASGSSTRLLDTRKTIPGLRAAQKYAVTCGGGNNHRHALDDGILIKENHIAAAGSVTAACRIAAAQRHSEEILLEVEVETIDQLHEALAAGAPRILLDNMTLEQLRTAVAITSGRAELEASGNITRDNLATYGAIGLDYISVGAITKHLRAIDLSMRITLNNSQRGA